MPGSARIWLPAEKGVRRPLKCETCGSGFRMEQMAEWQRHVIDCSNQHEDEERALSPRNYLGGAFSPSNGYVVDDLESWCAKNREDIISGRKRM